MIMRIQRKYPAKGQSVREIRCSLRGLWTCFGGSLTLRFPWLSDINDLFGKSHPIFQCVVNEIPRYKPTLIIMPVLFLANPPFSRIHLLPAAGRMPHWHKRNIVNGSGSVIQAWDDLSRWLRRLCYQCLFLWFVVSSPFQSYGFLSSLDGRDGKLTSWDLQATPLSGWATPMSGWSWLTFVGPYWYLQLGRLSEHVDTYAFPI